MDLPAFWKAFRANPLVHITLFVSFFITTMIINVIQFILYFTLGKYDKDMFRTANYYCLYTIYVQLLFLADWWADFKVKLHLPRKIKNRMNKDHGIFIMNHHYELDWLAGWVAADRNGLLGNARVFVKDEIRFMPLIGFAWSLSNYIFLARKAEKDRAAIQDGVAELQTYLTPIWLLLFPEGTRLSDEKLIIANEFARSRGRPELRNHLQPRSKGFKMSLEKIDAEKVPLIYDVTIVFKEDERLGRPTMVSLLHGGSMECEMFVRTFETKELLDRTDKEIEGFLVDLFVEKDRLKHSFLESGRFDNRETDKEDYECLDYSQGRPPTLLLPVLFNYLTLRYVILPAFIGGSWTWTASVAGTYGVLFLVLRFMMNFVRMDKASSYGSSAKKEK